MRKASAIELDEAQREKLMKLAHSNTTEVRLARRASIVLLAADGLDNYRIGEMLGVGRIQAGRWRERYAVGGLPAIMQDLPRGGRKPKIDPAEIVRLTTQTKPEGATQWSTRTLAAVVGVSDTTIQRIWMAHGLKPHRVKRFKVSRDPKFVEKLEDIVGLYLSPPEHALVLCCDEKSQVQCGGVFLRDVTVAHELAYDSTVFAFGQGVVVGLARARFGEFDPQLIEKLSGFMIDVLGTLVRVKAANHKREAVE